MSADTSKLPQEDVKLIDVIARAWCDGYRAAKDPDKTHVIPDFLRESEADFGERSSKYAMASIEHYGIRGSLKQLADALDELPRTKDDTAHRESGGHPFKPTEQAEGRSDVPIERVLDLIAGKPNESTISVGDVRFAAMVGNATDADIERGEELAKERGWNA